MKQNIKKVTAYELGDIFFKTILYGKFFSLILDNKASFYEFINCSKLLLSNCCREFGKKGIEEAIFPRNTLLELHVNQYSYYIVTS